jgi:large subunit ribosomal protein L13
MSTYLPKAGGEARRWFLIDAKDQVLGKLATAAAEILSGKRNPFYTPFLDTGDHVIVINAAELHLTGRKAETKLYRRHSGHLGGLKSIAAGDQLRKNPARVVEDAVRGMLPKTKLGRAMFGKLKVYARADHPHRAQKPKAVAIARRGAR